MYAVRLLAATTLAAIDTTVESVLSNWLHDWSVDPQPVSVGTEVWAPSVAQSSDSLCLRHPSGASIWLFVEDRRWLTVLFPNKAEQCPEDAIAAHLIARSKLNLASRLFMAFGLDSTEAATSREVCPKPETYSGYVRCQIGIGDTSFDMLLNAALLTKAKKPRPTAASIPLVTRADALLDSDCRAIVTLDLGQLHLQQLQSLSVGDTLLSDTPLSQSFEVRIGDSVKLSGLLGRSGNRKAISLIKP